ncbi:hypothetical protein BV133_2519 [Blastochloris viridis]|uniref:Uncharacterized protein n=1 Tax=Blastochloris viridis TaxID=1079 RepID=A0A182D5Q1_BLAVI|nr:hypothetical protein BV133_2519 [Blastochloris viridis]
MQSGLQSGAQLSAAKPLSTFAETLETESAPAAGTAQQKGRA